MSRKKVIIDCDPGTDDAQAIMMALADNNIQVVAITTVYGNSFADDTTRNALRLLTFCKRLDIPVYKGCASSLTFGFKRSAPFHGHDGMGDILIDEVDPVDIQSLSSEHASTALCRLVSAEPGNITLVAIGPLTNIAVALMLDNHFGEKLKDCVIMGGNYLGRGNAGSSAEYNWFCDPEAAHAVLASIHTNLTIVPFETCEDSYLSWDWYEAVSSQPNKAAQFLRRIDEHVVGIQKARKSLKYMAWDQLAMAIVIDPNVVIETKHVYSSVELHGGLTRGQMVIDWSQAQTDRSPNVTIVTKVNQQLYEKLISTAYSLSL
jgi:inosine-uridine nucleoside N-ribohydrolase